MKPRGGGVFGQTPPAWMEAMRDRAGPLLGAAMRFAQSQGHDPFPPGREGIRLLARLVEEAAFDPELDDDADAGFVEGAGAMLALLLMGHVGLGRHRERGGVHRIELGERGFFDPFGAIDAALDAEHPMVELQRRVASAEAEAAGEGPVARTVGAFAEALSHAGLPSKTRSSFGPHVELDDGVEVDLSRFVAMAGDEGADLEGSIARLVSMLGARNAGSAPTPYADVEARLLPRIAPARFFAELESDSTGPTLARRALSADLHVALVVASEGRLRFVRADELARWQAEGHDPYAGALARLDERARDTRLLPACASGAEGLLATRADGLAATLVLAPRFRAVLAHRFANGCVVALPHRDELLAFPDGVDLDILREQVLDKYRRAPHGVSSELFRPMPDGSLAPIR